MCELIVSVSGWLRSLRKHLRSIFDLYLQPAWSDGAAKAIPRGAVEGPKRPKESQRKLDPKNRGRRRARRQGRNAKEGRKTQAFPRRSKGSKMIRRGKRSPWDPQDHRITQAREAQGNSGKSKDQNRIKGNPGALRRSPGESWGARKAQAQGEPTRTHGNATMDFL